MATPAIYRTPSVFAATVIVTANDTVRRLGEELAHVVVLAGETDSRGASHNSN